MDHDDASGSHRGRGRAVVGAVAFALALALPSCGSDSPPPQADPQLELGRTIFVTRCASCHGSAGGGLIGPKLAGGAVAARYPDVADQRTVVAEGRGTMPRWKGILSDEEIDAVVRFTREGL